MISFINGRVFGNRFNYRCIRYSLGKNEFINSTLNSFVMKYAEKSFLNASFGNPSIPTALLSLALFTANSTSYMYIDSLTNYSSHWSKCKNWYGFIHAPYVHHIH